MKIGTMMRFGTKLVWTVAIIMTVLAAQSEPAFAQRRVFSNEDIPSAPASEPAAAPAADQAAPSDQPPPKSADKPADMPATPVAELNRLKVIQQTLLDLYDEIAVKADDIKDPVLKQRFTGMTDALGTVIRANKATIEEQEAKLGAAAAAQPAPAEPSGSAESQTAPVAQ